MLIFAFGFIAATVVGGIVARLYPAQFDQAVALARK